jgi:hypothetical protein
MAQSGHLGALNQCPLLGVKRTSSYIREYALSEVPTRSAKSFYAHCLNNMHELNSRLQATKISGEDRAAAETRQQLKIEQ